MANKTPKPPINPVRPKMKRGVPVSHERWIGRLILASGHAEAAMQDAIWNILNVPMEDGRILTARMNANTKLQWLRALAKRHLHGDLLEELTKSLDRLEVCMDDRNFVVHGAWGTRIAATWGDGDVPIALSLREKSKPDEIIAETFPEDRMQQIVRDMTEAKDDLRAWSDRLLASRGKPPQPQTIE
jgi:hypothetical protein